MGAARIRVLDRADLEAIDEATRVLLYHTGVKVQSKEARDVLGAAGARTAPNSERVLFSDRVLAKAFEAAPKTVLLASRDGKHDVRIPDGVPHITTDGCGVNVLDLETGLRRPSMSKDLAELTRVADALDSVDVQWPMVVAGDVPSEVHGIVEAGVTFENTTKNVEHEAVSRGEAERIVAMSAAVAGGRDELRERPVFSSVQCPVSPLTFEEGATDATLVLARAGVPLVPISMVLMGGSCPVDLAGAMVVANAENLASIAIAEAAAPGSPIVYSISSGPIDMRSGSFTTGAPETSLMSVMGVEMARFYGLPCMVGGLSADADAPGFQAGVEKAGIGLPPMLAGADLISGVGSLETDSTLSAEQLVLDDDLVAYGRRLMANVPVNADTIHLDMLSRLGPGGNYLKEKHTLLHHREALWSPKVLVREGYTPGASAEARLRARAQARAREILKAHEPTPLEPDVRKAMWAAAGVPPP